MLSMDSDCKGQRVLLVEESATLRYILSKALQKQGCDLVSLETFEEAFAVVNQKEDEIHALIIGWPNYKAHEQANKLISLLETEDHCQLPALVVANEADVDLLNWMGRRKHSAMVPWESYQDAIPSLFKLR